MKENSLEHWEQRRKKTDRNDRAVGSGQIWSQMERKNLRQVTPESKETEREREKRAVEVWIN